MRRGEPTYPEILEALSHEYEGPIPERELAERVLAIKSSTAKTARHQLQTLLRDESVRFGWLRLPKGMVSPLRLAMANLRFRVIPSPNEVAEQHLERQSLHPFLLVFMHELTVRFEGHDDLQFHTVRLREHIPLKDWMERVHFQSGDSILVTIQSYPPMVMSFEHEPAAAFQPDRVQAQEQELVELAVQQFSTKRSKRVEAYKIILPAYAAAPWRTQYPGRPWQQVLAEDERVEVLYDGLMLQLQEASAYGRVSRSKQGKKSLFEQIAELQSDLRALRQTMIQRGYWDGVVQRVTASLLFGFNDKSTPPMEPIDATQDYSAQIDERAKDGYYDRMFVDEILDFEELFDQDDDYELMGTLFDTIDLTLSYDYQLDETSVSSMQEFTLFEEQERLIKVLGAERIARLEQAQTESEALKLLITFLNELMDKEPSLFEELVITPSQAKQKMNSDSNGNGLHLPIDESLLLSDDPFEDEDESEFFDEEEFEDEEFEDEDFEDELINAERNALIMQAINRSTQLLQRFFDAQLEQGQDARTAQERVRFMSHYASFLGTFYQQSLEMSTYAMLDEYLFFVFPRQNRLPSRKDVRAMCLALKQFYAFLRAERIIASDAMIQELYRHRNLVVRLVSLYEQINSSPRSFGHLFARLFEPYTA
jgi:hypothetical protein